MTEKICGASVTAEQIRKTYRNGTAKSFNYYRCSNQSSKCSQRDKTYMKAVAGRNVSYTQDEIEKIFADIFKSFSFDEVTCQRMKQYHGDEHLRPRVRTRLDSANSRHDKYSSSSSSRRPMRTNSVGKFLRNCGRRIPRGGNWSGNKFWGIAVVE